MKTSHRKCAFKELYVPCRIQFKVSAHHPGPDEYSVKSVKVDMAVPGRYIALLVVV